MGSELAQSIWSDFLKGREKGSRKVVEPSETFCKEGYILHRELCSAMRERLYAASRKSSSKKGLPQGGTPRGF